MPMMSRSLIESFAARDRTRGEVVICNMGRVLGSQYRDILKEELQRALARLPIRNPETEAAIVNPAQDAAQRRCVADALVREDFPMPLMEDPSWRAVEDGPPVPPVFAPVLHFRFADRLLEECGDNPPIYSIKPEVWQLVQSKYGRPGERHDAGLREWRPEFYDQIVAFITAQNPPAPAPPSTRKGSGVSAVAG